MVKIELKVPHFKQRKITCGPSSLQQIFAYYGKYLNLDEILKGIKMFKYGTWTGYLGKYALEKGFDAEIFYYNVNYVDPSWMTLPNVELLKKLEIALKKEKRKKKKEGILSLIEFLKAGGKINFQIPSKILLVNFLRKKLPIIILLCSTIFYKRKRFDQKRNRHSEYGEPIGHFLVISGYENGKFIVTDSHSVVGGKYKVPENKLIFSWFYWGGDCLIIKPKSKND